MLEASVSLKPELSSTASLGQAIAWIANGVRPLTPEYQKILHGTEEFEPTGHQAKAYELLLMALLQGHIQGCGDLNEIKWRRVEGEEPYFRTLDNTETKHRQYIPKELWGTHAYARAIWSPIIKN